MYIGLLAPHPRKTRNRQAPFPFIASRLLKILRDVSEHLGRAESGTLGLFFGTPRDAGEAEVVGGFQVDHAVRETGLGGEGQELGALFAGVSREVHDHVDPGPYGLQDEGADQRAQAGGAV